MRGCVVLAKERSGYLQNKLTIDPEGMARIEEAIQELSRRELPKVWIGEPNRDGHGDLNSARVDWFSLSRVMNEIEDCSLSPHTERKLFEQSLHVQAAKRQLVVVKKIMPRDGVTLEEARLIASFRKSLLVKGKKSHQWNLEPQGSWPHPEEWVYEDTVLLFDYPPDSNFPLESTHFYRFIARNKLAFEHKPYIEDFLFQAEAGPFEEYPILATEETEFMADVLRGIAQL